MNTSGINPIEYNVLLKQDVIDEKTKGGLVLPGEAVEQKRHAQTRGIIVAISPMAFMFDDWPISEPKPVPGQRVAWARHAGTFVEGNDGEEYRVVKDKDIVAVLS